MEAPRGPFLSEEGEMRKRTARILVVEDDETTRENFIDFLQNSLQYVVVAVASAEEAENLVSETEFDLFFIDRHLGPGKDGVQFVRWLRDRKIWKPVIILSGYPDNEVLKIANTLKVNFFIGKPAPNKLIETAIRISFRSESRGLLYLERAGDGTLKYLLPITSRNGNLRFYESASLVLDDRRDERQVICISSQTGCKMGCAFCATGNQANKGVRNLTVRNMRAQIQNAEIFHGFSGEVLISIMGMGEPTLNLKNILALINESEDRHKFAISTVGLIPRLQQLINILAKNPKLELVQLSLHFPNDKMRVQHMMTAKRNPIHRLLDLGEEYTQRSGKALCVNSTLYAGINDSESCVRALSALMKNRPFFVRVSEANEFGIYKKSKRLAETRAIFEEDEIPFKVFASKGSEGGSTSGCGQMSADASVRYPKYPSQ
jgi:adenine C2-methylase RlmN of 23S rRNA A2503 and tRNA A37